jgi:hypothetical protein
LINIFRHDEKGRRPVFGAYEKMQADPHFKDYILFHEYFDGDTGKASAPRTRPAGPHWLPT